MSSYVYVISNGIEYKIGKADNVGTRIKQLQTGSSHKLKIIHEIECYGNAHVMESILHKRFSSFRTIGEWFALDKYSLLALDVLVYTYTKLVDTVDTLEGKHWWYSNIDLIHTLPCSYTAEMQNRAEKLLAEMANLKFKLASTEV